MTASSTTQSPSLCRSTLNCFESESLANVVLSAVASTSTGYCLGVSVLNVYIYISTVGIEIHALETTWTRNILRKGDNSNIMTKQMTELVQNS